MKAQEKETYEKTLELFNNCCAICRSNQVQCHHIRYGGLYGGRKTYMGNIIPLCKKHHDMVHKNKKKYMPILIDMVNRRINE